MKELAELRPKMHSYLTDNVVEGKKAKGSKERLIKQEIKLEDYKNCLENNIKTTAKVQQ